MQQNSRIALGTVQFGLDYGISNKEGKPTLNEVKSILDFAGSKGVTLLDTANAYGEAEEVIGRLNLNRFDVVTKFLPESQNGTIEKQFNESLRKLNTECVYGLIAHRPLDVVNNPIIWDKMNSLKDRSKVIKIGFSFNTPEEYRDVVEKSFKPDLVQIPFNYFDNRFEEIIDELKSKDCEIHVRSSFLQGLFFMDVNELPIFFTEVKPIIQGLQDSYREALASGLLKYVLGNQNIDKLVVGIQNLKQLEQIFQTLDKAPILKKLNTHIDSNILQPSLWPN